MDIIVYNEHEKLIPFYSKRGIEELTDYPNPPIFSYVVMDEENLVGAATCSKKDEFYILEAIAVAENYAGKGIGSELLSVVFNRLRELGAKDVILNAKDVRFFKNNGFAVTDRSNVPESAYSYCAGCEDFGVKCFPQVMKCEIKKLEDKPKKK